MLPSQALGASRQSGGFFGRNDSTGPSHNSQTVDGRISTSRMTVMPNSHSHIPGMHFNDHEDGTSTEPTFGKNQSSSDWRKRGTVTVDKIIAAPPQRLSQGPHQRPPQSRASRQGLHLAEEGGAYIDPDNAGHYLLWGQLLEVLNGLLEMQEVRLCSTLLHALGDCQHSGQRTSVTVGEFQRLLGSDTQTMPSEESRILIGKAGLSPSDIRSNRISLMRMRVDSLQRNEPLQTISGISSAPPPSPPQQQKQAPPSPPHHSARCNTASPSAAPPPSAPPQQKQPPHHSTTAPASVMKLADDEEVDDIAAPPVEPGSARKTEGVRMSHGWLGGLMTDFADFEETAATSASVGCDSHHRTLMGSPEPQQKSSEESVDFLHKNAPEKNLKTKVLSGQSVKYREDENDDEEKAPGSGEAPAESGTTSKNRGVLITEKVASNRGLKGGVSFGGNLGNDVEDDDSGTNSVAGDEDKSDDEDQDDEYDDDDNEGSDGGEDDEDDDDERYEGAGEMSENTKGILQRQATGVVAEVAASKSAAAANATRNTEMNSSNVKAKMSIARESYDEEDELLEMEMLVEYDIDNVQGLAQRTHRLIIHPNSTEKHVWDLFSLVFIVVEAFLIPLNVGLDMEVSLGWYWLTTSWFCIDICLSCLTGYFSDGKLVMQQQLILRRFVIYQSVIDVSAAIPWEYVLSLAGTSDEDSSFASFARFGKLLRIVRLLRLVKLNDLYHRMEELLPGSTLIVALGFLKMVAMFALICHWAACVWAFIGSPEKVGHSSFGEETKDFADCEPGGPCEGGIMGSPWMHRYGVEGSELGNVQSKYLLALGFATAIITGGDLGLMPGWWAERLYTVVMMIISFVICSMILSQIVVFMNKLSAEKTQFRENMNAVKEYMVRRNVSRLLRAKVKRYLEFQFRSQRRNGEGIEFISQLSPWLRLELKEHLNRDIIQRHPIFQDLPALPFKRVCAIAAAVLYAPGDLVAQRGHAASCMFFIVSGRLKVLGGSNARKSSHGSMEKGDFLEAPSWLGDQCLFQQMTRNRTVICLTHTELLTLPQDLFAVLLKEFPKLRRWFVDWRRKIANGNFIEAGMQCEVCKGMGHSSEQCPQALEKIKEADGKDELTSVNDRKKRDKKISKLKKGNSSHGASLARKSLGMALIKGNQALKGATSKVMLANNIVKQKSTDSQKLSELMGSKSQGLRKDDSNTDDMPPTSSQSMPPPSQILPGMPQEHETATLEAEISELPHVNGSSKTVSESPGSRVKGILEEVSTEPAPPLSLTGTPAPPTGEPDSVVFRPGGARPSSRASNSIK